MVSFLMVLLIIFVKQIIESEIDSIKSWEVNATPIWHTKMPRRQQVPLDYGNISK